MKQFAVNIANTLTAGSNSISFGAITFGATAQSSFYLNSYTHIDDVTRHLRTLVNPQSGSGLVEALHLLQHDQFASVRGDRSSACNIAVVLVDGKWFLTVAGPSYEAPLPGTNLP